MKSTFGAVMLLSLFLGACQTSTLTEEEKMPVEETMVPFSGETKSIDKSQSVISFTGKSNIINHEGKFNDYTAELTLDSAGPADLEKATIQATLNLKDIDVDAEGLKAHLQKEDFLNTELFPTATFTSTSIRRIEGNSYAITGKLTLKGQTKEQTITAEITDDYLTAMYEFPREEFGIGNNSYGSKLLESTVPVNIKIVFAK